MTPTTGCLILAVVCVGLAIALCVVLTMLWRAIALGNEFRKCAIDWEGFSDAHESAAVQLAAQLDTTTNHNRDLQATIAELESERRAYDLTVANCDHLRAENERLEKQLEAMGIKPAAVLAAEHDNVGVKPTADFIKPVRFQARVRDDETND